MQILYAAPFLVLAAVSFFVCASIPKFRTHALVVPVGFLTFGVGALITFFIFSLIVEKFGYKGPANWFYLIPYIVGGLLAAVVCTAIYNVIVAVLPLWIIRIGLIIGTLCSALVLGSVINIAAVSHLHSVTIGWRWGFIAVIACSATVSTASHAELFRPQSCLPWLRTRISRASAATSSN